MTNWSTECLIEVCRQVSTNQMTLTCLPFYDVWQSWWQWRIKWIRPVGHKSEASQKPPRTTDFSLAMVVLLLICWTTQAMSEWGHVRNSIDDTHDKEKLTFKT